MSRYAVGQRVTLAQEHAVKGLLGLPSRLLGVSGAVVRVDIGPSIKGDDQVYEVLFDDSNCLYHVYGSMLAPASDDSVRPAN